MAIKTYDDLMARMADWLNRGDLVAVIPDFIALFEASYNDDERGRIQKSVVISTADVAGEYIPVPADYIQMQNLRVPGSTANPKGLDFLSPQQMGWFRERYVVPEEPKYYSIIGQQVQLLPVPDKQYTLEMQYFGKLPPLSADNETNWLLNDHPNVYLYGSLLHAEPYLKNDERIATWKALYDEAMEKLNVTDDRALFSGSTLKMRTRSFG